LTSFGTRQRYASWPADGWPAPSHSFFIAVAATVAGLTVASLFTAVAKPVAGLIACFSSPP
jgi:hypothetical protein